MGIFRRLAGVAGSLCLFWAALDATAADTTAPWWKHALVYEIYPRSFGDSNGDGVGDLNGINAHLDDLQKLGVDAIWIAPMYPSPQADFGYDISDYQAIDPQYGTMADFDRLQQAAKQRHIHVILDMVMNHTSDHHAWFVESASSRNNPKSDWYVWNDGIPADTAHLSAVQRRNIHDGKAPPNNWESMFGGSAWQWVPARQQFYYHRFYIQQPDLNWRNPDVEKAMFGAIRFWLDRGVDGFRLDAISVLFEDTKLRNDPERPGTNAQGEPNLNYLYSDKLPEVHGVMRRLRALVDSYPGQRVLIGETYEPNIKLLDEWYGTAEAPQLQLPMNLQLGFGWQASFDATWFRTRLQESQQVHGQPLLVVDNHDNPRSIDRFGDGTHDVERAKVVAAALLTSRAVALTYYGAPIGMTTATPTRVEDVRDPVGVTGWPKDKGRDGERTPMQWTPGPQAGFSTNPRTWLPVNPNHATVNVEDEWKQPESLLNWHRQLIALRRDNPALRDGAMTFLDTRDPNVLIYRREGEHPVLVMLNFSGSAQLVPKRLMQGKVRTLAASEVSLRGLETLDGASLPAYSAWIVTPD
ncbi:alpha-glucosidase [Luteibacter sp. 1214]|uniref:alpha-glucosidase n=1 Tax=Luteibacter sp. 1214 TaxID=2817735 RepID=UPI00286533F6|nr:alpha-glucosidase [Luteibacter sp. 1214]MDR6642269.1 alpha-glucosidase [Luteibacter sp. 1214]